MYETWRSKFWTPKGLKVACLQFLSKISTRLQLQLSSSNYFPIASLHIFFNVDWSCLWVLGIMVMFVLASTCSEHFFTSYLELHYLTVVYFTTVLYTVMTQLEPHCKHQNYFCRFPYSNNLGQWKGWNVARELLRTGSILKLTCS